MIFSSVASSLFNIPEISVRTLNTKCSGVDQMTVNLSGGNQQKVIIGKWLAVIFPLEIGFAPKIPSIHSDLPAPISPPKPKISPFLTSKLIFLAVLSLRVKFSTLKITSLSFSICSRNFRYHKSEKIQGRRIDRPLK